MSENKSNWFKRHKILTVVGIVIVLGVIAGAAGGGDSGTGTPTNSETSGNTTAAATTAKVGEAARDGKFEFTVSSVKCGVPTVSDSSGYLSKSAQGQYCELNVAVKNIGDEPQMFDGSNQYLFNSSGQKYTYDSTATIYANPSNSTFLNNINPGNSASGIVIFDIPKDAVPATAELHDSAFSGGVKVQL